MRMKQSNMVESKKGTKLIQVGWLDLHTVVLSRVPHLISQTPTSDPWMQNQEEVLSIARQDTKKAKQWWQQKKHQGRA